jgi:hypothetical protein
MPDMIALRGRIAACLAVPLVAACVQSVPEQAAPADGGGAEAAACITAVNARIGVPGAVVTAVAPDPEGAVVSLTDGSGPWRCTARADGTVTDLAFGV